MDAAHALVLRVGGPTAASQFARLFTQGYPKGMQTLVSGVATERLKLEVLPAPARKRDRATVPGSRERLAVWQRFGADVPELRYVALRLLSVHATSAAPERNWSLWGRIYCAARSTLGLQRAKALIAICAAEKAKISPSEAFNITLSFVEEDVRV
jgi:hAT family C-terminal dimerisation region